MVSTATRNDPVACVCGAAIKPTGQRMHETGKVHQEWATTQAGGDEAERTQDVDSPEPEPMHEALVSILGSRDKGSDPRVLARQLREVYAAQDWPDRDHLETQVEFLNGNGIPIITMPRHSTPDEVNTYTNNWMNVLKDSDWGRQEWDCQGFYRNWSAFIAAKEEAARVAAAGGTNG